MQMSRGQFFGIGAILALLFSAGFWTFVQRGRAEQTLSSLPAAATHGSVAPKSHGSSSKGSKLTAPGQGTVNINRASAEELQRLPGVGPAMAARILDFRKTNGAFTAADQLM